MSQLHIKWLTEELPRLVGHGLLTDEQCKAILVFYENRKKQRPNLALISFSILGAILLASGIILILAHNWSDLPRWLRVVFSFLPLVAAQMLAFRVLSQKSDSVAWKEGTAAFAFLVVGSAIALVSQTYHIQGDIRTFLLTWMILAVPYVYLFQSTTGAVLYLIGITSLGAAHEVYDSQAIMYWVLFIMILPFYRLQNRRLLNRGPVVIMEWFMAVSLIVGTAVAVNDISEGFKALLFIGLFLSMFSLGALFQSKSGSFWSTPFYRLGLLGLSVCYLILSYGDIWEHLSFSESSASVYYQVYWGDYTISIGILTLAVTLTGIAWIRKNLEAGGMLLGLLLAFLGFSVSGFAAGRGMLTIAFNVYVFCGGLLYLGCGIKSGSGKTLNFGFALIAALVVLRFFDSDLSFVLRGIIFVILGTGFLMANLFLAKRKAA